MNKKNTTITIGIPAFNEEQNIGKLIKALLAQDYANVKLENILIVSDGSTDKTVEELKKIKNEKISVIDRKKRKGAMNTQNEILSLANSDILIMLDADVLPYGRNFVRELIKPILDDRKVGLVGAAIDSIPGRGFFERVISDSHDFKKSVYEKFNQGDNVYMCHGRARAFKKGFYKNLTWAEEGPEDAFSYLYCKKRGFKFKFAPKAIVQFRSPARFDDHAKQSMRFEQGKRNIEKYFNKKVVEIEYKIPFKYIAADLARFLLKSPLKAISFLFIKLYILYLSERKQVDLSTWDIATSSKKLSWK